MSRLEEFSVTSSAIMAFGVVIFAISISQILSINGSVGILVPYTIGLCGIMIAVWGFVYDV